MTVNIQDVAAEIRAWLRESELDAGASLNLNQHSDLLADGIVDSFGMLELLTWIDQRFGVFVEFGEGDELLTQFGPLVDHVAARMQVLDVS